MALHQYSSSEIEQVFGGMSGIAIAFSHINSTPPYLLPYPGGRHPRIGFLDGMINPQRGTKVSLFTPWDEGSYVVFDLPEAIFSNLGLTFLAHTHIPTIWDDMDKVIENVDWTKAEDGGLTFTRELPNGIRFGSTVKLKGGGADAMMWLENGTDAPLTKLRTQVCAMLGAVPGFERQTNEEKWFESSVSVAKATGKDRYILVAFDHVGRTWGNKACPCIHADPIFPDAAPGERVEVKGRLWFYEGSDIEGEIKRAETLFQKL